MEKDAFFNNGTHHPQPPLTTNLNHHHHHSSSSTNFPISDLRQLPHRRTLRRGSQIWYVVSDLIHIKS
ncbi:hypothetical protein Hanom_Chr07g00670161 [Helianthus anomalus]